MAEQSANWWKELSVEWYDLIDVPLDTFNDPAAFQHHPLPIAVEALLMLSSSQTSQSMQFQSKKRKRIIWTAEEHRFALGHSVASTPRIQIGGESHASFRLHRFILVDPRHPDAARLRQHFRNVDSVGQGCSRRRGSHELRVILVVHLGPHRRGGDAVTPGEPSGTFHGIAVVADVLATVGYAPHVHVPRFPQRSYRRSNDPHQLALTPLHFGI
ncbi:uncharacterized protein HKW66_Vig0223030 [Vigna angularis]|uniref:Uncharacterized protein n=1 Tax=Phaseolus angularis TaxID=3914 RepID=A0A8T0JZK7_PHAAN|nr:uncharacterized protein HKW66_Vig0223030 [Vigna angularis]